MNSTTLRNTPFKYFLSLSCLILCACCFTPEASAKERSELEKSVLPAYCKARLYGTELEKKKWEGVLGRSNFVWMNHYCGGLMEIFKCERILKENMRNACLTEKVKSMNYTLKNTSEDFPIRYMVYFTRGDIFFRTGVDHKAEQDFLKTITMKPKFIRPYTRLFDLYYENGDLEKAGEIIERGLKEKPNSRSIKRRKKKLEQHATSGEKAPDEKAPDEKAPDEKASDEKASDEKASDEKTPDDK